MEPWHLMHVAMRARDEDVVDFLAFGIGDSRARQKWACQRALDPGLAVAVLDASGEPRVCFGAFDTMPGVATAWLASIDLAPHGRACLRAWRMLVREGGWRRIQAHVLRERLPAHDLVEWLGFGFEVDIPGVRVDNGIISQYAIVR